MRKICSVMVLTMALFVVIPFGYPAHGEATPAVTGSPTLPGKSPVGPAPHKVIPDPRWTCPRGPYINCMPPVTEKNRSVCSRENLEWIKENCPGVKVVY